MPKIDKEKCTGCGACAAICGEVFEMVDDGKAKVKEGTDCAKAGCCSEAAETCPTDAITL
ncbi:unnamed protein product [marine sediment metagenome]|uniref:4Fe-4S ferredoxin-type domain-containing protein n=1 Tax=marine sediment metagenome TaxID=412755 RepID=X0W671_9ZZZZ